MSSHEKFYALNTIRITITFTSTLRIVFIVVEYGCVVHIAFSVVSEAYLHSFVYLKFQQILVNLVRRAKGTQRHIRSIAEVRRVASHRLASPRLISHHLASHPIPSHPIPSCPIPSHPVPSRSVPFCPVPLIRAWTISLLVLEVADGTRGGSGGCSGVCRRNYTIKWCPDGRQLGAPWYSPFSSCHSESICIVMAPRVASLPTPLRINTAVDCHRKYRPSETKPSSHSFP